MKNNLINKNEQTDDSLRNDPLFNKIESRMKFYELLVNASSDGMLSINMDGIITFINPAGMKILGIGRNTLYKKIKQYNII